MMQRTAASIVLGTFLLGMAGCDGRPPAAALTANVHQRHEGATEAGLVKVKVLNKSGELVGPVEMPKVVKSDEEWQKQLTPEQYRVARAKGTERAFCGTLLDNKMHGVYACIGCGLPLFSSDSKFNSGTGWPSFFQPVAQENVVEEVDSGHGMVRSEILCARCDTHLGHVFDDGPRPTGLRFCVNSESLVFTPKEKLASLADPAAEGAPAAAPASRPTK
jgi:methionine-R-sulfoxide reductase